MAVNCVRTNETEEKKYHHSVVAVVFDCIYHCLQFISKALQAEVKGVSMLMYGI